MKLPIAGIPPIESSQVHVWSLPDPEQFDLMNDAISAEERARARTYRLPRDRERFIVCRTVLRKLLGAYGSKDPNAVALIAGPNGKPLESGGRTHFNLSHCDGMAVFAFSREHEVGVDVERLRYFPDMHELIKRYGSGRDLQRFQGLRREQLAEAFFRWWTVREAQAKCSGEGLQALERPLDVGDVIGAAFEEILLPTDVGVHRVFHISPAKGFAGALCSSAEVRSIRTMDATALLATEAVC